VRNEVGALYACRGGVWGFKSGERYGLWDEGMLGKMKIRRWGNYFGRLF
jgi:hypothetical protein